MANNLPTVKNNAPERVKIKYSSLATNQSGNPRLILSADNTNLDFWDNTFIDKDNKYFSPGYLGNAYMTNPWSTVLIGNIQAPGLCSVTITRKRAIDKKKPSGVDIGTVTPHGILPSEFDIEFTIWTPQQWYLFKKFINDPNTPAQVLVTTTKTLRTEVANSQINQPAPSTGPTSGSSTNLISLDANLNPILFPNSSAQINATSYVTTKTKSTQLVSGSQAILPLAGIAPGIFPVIHPALAFHGIAHMMPIGMTVHKIGQDRKGKFVLHCVEFHQKGDQPPVVSTPQFPAGIYAANTITPPGQAIANNNAATQSNNGVGTTINNPINAANTTIPFPQAMA